jgi:hypothetical protein
LLATVTVLITVAASPASAARFIVTSIRPLSPGASAHGCAGRSATVQLQEVETDAIATPESDTLVTLKVKRTSAVPLVTVTAFIAESQASTPSSGDACAPAGGATVAADAKVSGGCRRTGTESAACKCSSGPADRTSIPRMTSTRFTTG